MLNTVFAQHYIIKLSAQSNFTLKKTKKNKINKLGQTTPKQALVKFKHNNIVSRLAIINNHIQHFKHLPYNFPGQTTRGRLRHQKHPLLAVSSAISYWVIDSEATRPVHQRSCLDSGQRSTPAAETKLRASSKRSSSQGMARGPGALAKPYSSSAARSSFWKAGWLRWAARTTNRRELDPTATATWPAGTSGGAEAEGEERRRHRRSSFRRRTNCRILLLLPRPPPVIAESGEVAQSQTAGRLGEGLVKGLYKGRCTKMPFILFHNHLANMDWRSKYKINDYLVANIKIELYTENFKNRTSLY